jgi:hypothetical protein
MFEQTPHHLERTYLIFLHYQQTPHDLGLELQRYKIYQWIFGT